MIQTAVSGRKVGFGQSGWGISARKVGFWPDGTAFPVGKWRSDVPDRRFPSEKPPPVSLKRSFGTKGVSERKGSIGRREGGLTEPTDPPPRTLTRLTGWLARRAE